jgi:N-acylglucosamine-6-phosphate 2-epimerase
LPIIAIHTDAGPDRTVAITPTVQHALALIDAGADIVALDATMSARQHDGQDIGEMVSYIRRKTGVPVMADVSTVADGLNAADAGVLLVGSSTTGYGHPDTTTLPNLRLVEDLVGVLEVPVIAERGYSTLEHVRTAFELGALAVVVGSAITDPAFITARFRDVAEAPATTARTRPGDYT